MAHKKGFQDSYQHKVLFLWATQCNLHLPGYLKIRQNKFSTGISVHFVAEHHYKVSTLTILTISLFEG